MKLLAPLVPGTFYCAGVNYRSHVIKMAAKRNAEPKFPDAADIGYRSPNAIIANGEAIVKPKDAGNEFQYEAELVAIVGKKGKNIPKEKALEHVFGWTIGNDVSERAWQRGDRTMWRGKDTDTFKPMGPWIVTGLDYRKMRTIVKLDGKEVENFATGDMIFSVEDFIERMTKYVTIHPGDVIWMGTDGVPENMRPGQTCEIEITGIGKLANPIVLESSGRARAAGILQVVMAEVPTSGRLLLRALQYSPASGLGTPCLPSGGNPPPLPFPSRGEGDYLKAAMTLEAAIRPNLRDRYCHCEERMLRSNLDGGTRLLRFARNDSRKECAPFERITL